MENKDLHDGEHRRAAIRELLGEEVYAKRRDALNNAESVREAARFIRSMREHASLTQDALARRLGVTQARISEIERGDSPEGVSYALLKRVAAACGVENWPSSPVDVHKTQQEQPVLVEVMPSSVLKVQQEVAEAYTRLLDATHELRAKLVQTKTRQYSAMLRGGGRIKDISDETKRRSEKRAFGAYVSVLTKFERILSRNVKETTSPSKSVLVVAETEGRHKRTESAVQIIRDALDQSPQVRVVDKQQ